MKQFKRLFALLLMVCMVCCLFGCGGSESSESQSSEASESESKVEESSQQEEESVDDGKMDYTITVVDEDNNPIANAMVQMCLESCFPAVTNADGVAEFRMAEADYKVSFVMMPAGYEHVGAEQEFYFEDGSYEMTIVLKAVEAE